MVGNENVAIEDVVIANTNNQQPTTNNQQPTTNNQQPTNTNQQPTTNNQEPYRDWETDRKSTRLNSSH